MLAEHIQLHLPMIEDEAKQRGRWRETEEETQREGEEHRDRRRQSDRFRKRMRSWDRDASELEGV